MVAARDDCRTGRATLTTVPSIKDMLEPRMVAAIIQRPLAGDGSSHGRARITASSQGGLRISAMIHCELPSGCSETHRATRTRLASNDQGDVFGPRRGQGMDRLPDRVLRVGTLPSESCFACTSDF